MRPLIARVLDVLYPPTCVHCGRIGASWCGRCLETLASAPDSSQTRWLSPKIRAAAAAPYEGLLREAVLAFKFERATGLSSSLADRIAGAANAAGFSVDMVAAVPSHPERVRWRGYDHTALLAHAVSAAMALPSASLLERRRWTGPQVGRDATERHRAVQGAFTVTGTAIPPSVLLVDDVITTGATMLACAQALLDAGVSHVVCAAVCFA